MSREIKTEMKNHSINQFWGGNKRGNCLQITSTKSNICANIADQIQEEGFILLSMEDAVDLCNSLFFFIKEEALRRQKLLKEELKELKLKERTVFQEIVDLREELLRFPELTIRAISNYCPKAKKIELNDKEKK